MRMIVFAIMMVAPSIAAAGQRENVLNHAAQVIAISQLCSKVAVVEGNLLMLTSVNDVDFDRDQAELLIQMKRQMEPWQGKPEDAACQAGMMLYGPSGMNVPDLLKWK